MCSNADLTATEALLDRFDYPDGFAPEGAWRGLVGGINE